MPIFAFLPRWPLAFLLAIAVLFAGAAAHAQDDAPVPPPVEIKVDALRAQLASIPEELDRRDDFRKMVAAANAIQAQAELFVANRTIELAELDGRLTGLGPAPAKDAPAEPADVATQRATLQKSRDALDADLKLARLLVIDARQRAADLLTQRRGRFQAELTDRVDSPLGSNFWRTMRSAYPGDRMRFARLAQEVRIDLGKAAAAERRGPLLLALLAAVLIGFVGNWLAERTLIRIAPDRLPAGRLRRSLLAVAIVVANVSIIGLAAQIAFVGLDWHEVLTSRSRSLAQDVVRIAMMAAFIVGLGRALLSVRRSSWRLPPMSDAIAARLAPFPWLIALAAALVSLQRQINAATAASLEATVLTHGVSALLLGTLIAALLFRLRQPAVKAATAETATNPVLDAHAEADATTSIGDASPHGSPHASPAKIAASTPSGPLDRPQWVGPVIGVLAVLVVAVWVLVAVGYVALASFLAGQLVWVGIVGSTAYLLFKFADDLSYALLSSRGAFGRHLHQSLDVPASLLDQGAVVASALARIGLFFYLLIALAAPFGTTVDELVQRSGKFDTGIKVGEFAIAPGALFSALGVLVLGFLALRFFKRWLATSYFPSTTLETGTRSSISTLLGYGGGVVVVAMSLSAMGIGVERIAWVASALSVGIGFGLQAIVQNFISGLILLVERPIKVGDWVIIGDTEGDVRRINVRATEIQLGDRSTLIVPNSEFVTKTVRNMTLVNAEGRVLIRLPMPLTSNANQVRALILEVFAANSAMLREPEPTVLLDGIEGGMLMFRATGYVNNPRVAGGVRSELLFSILDALHAARLPLVAYAAPAAPAELNPAEPAAGAATSTSTSTSTSTGPATPTGTAALAANANASAEPAPAPATPSSPLPPSNH